MKRLTQEEELEFFSWFPNKISKEMADYATNIVLKKSRYLIFRKIGKKTVGYCTHCRTESVLDGKSVKSGKEATCPACNSKVFARHERYGTRKIHDHAIMVWYDKSPMDPRAIVASASEVRRDYSKGYRDVQTEFSKMAAYIFVPAQNAKSFGQTRMIKDGGEWSEGYKRWIFGWYQRRKLFSLVKEQNYIYPVMDVYCSHDSIRIAVAGTPFAYSCWDKVLDGNEDGILFFDYAARYPCMEYLIKGGMQDLAVERIYGRGGSALNLRGRTPWAVLRLSKERFREIRPHLKGMDTEALAVLQKGELKLSGYTVAEEMELIKLFDARTLMSGALEMGGLTTVRAAVRYLKSQLLPRTEAPSDRYRLDSIRNMWSDYIDECRQLGLNLDDDRVLYPKDLRQAHRETSDLIVSKANADINQKITAQLKKLRKKYSWQAHGLLIRPAASSNELIREGKELHICVGGMTPGGYIHRYADGRTILLLVRRMNEPDVPFYCVELSTKGELLQVRGDTNCPPTHEVMDFMDAWMLHISKPSKKQKSENRVQVAI